ncbi:peflin [Vespula maculifrons]|uniref:Peflin n=1 Tax=Vespula maculifrons TaxID=7453 RepID=A0ABD2ARW9_VESMC|nr:peflin [Vespula pensylvanica]XP_043683502.1 peflin [Vespula pensylvanica]XP_043683503.1 peflin [Vespula pensylvanica]XP_043683504.1 peflin [Vespula pensylvanica]XP_050867340.1 peflin [Vespula vulgaris]XP_050867341.1 peflin [Vespula vulgaris]XP_050867342.1 peflin [Vespula vulgaris]XP_050867343.1 peflin [Vespula vulgaris]
MYEYNSESQIRPEVQQWFALVDKDGSGRITATELQAALANGKGGTFSESACKLMINMFGHKQNGTIDVVEFQDVFKYINSWIDFLRSIDLDNSGSIQENELNEVLIKMGYKVSPKFVQFLMQKCDPGNCQSMSVDQFIVFCIQLDKFTGAFKARDTDRKGSISIEFEDFLTIALDCSFY